MKIKRFLNDNAAQSNCYVISYENDCYVIDPGQEEMDEVIAYIRENNLNFLANPKSYLKLLAELKTCKYPLTQLQKIFLVHPLNTGLSHQ